MFKQSWKWYKDAVNGETQSYRVYTFSKSFHFKNHVNSLSPELCLYMYVSFFNKRNVKENDTAHQNKDVLKFLSSW